MSILSSFDLSNLEKLKVVGIFNIISCVLQQTDPNEKDHQMNLSA